VAAEVPARLPLSDGRALRVLEQSDVDDLYALIEANRGHLARWLPWAAEQTRAGTLRFIRTTRWAMEPRQNCSLSFR